jgi:SAM-dependent methyltransferase
MNREKIIQKEFQYRKRLFKNNNYERKKLEILLGLLPQSGKILEVGCGYGLFSLLMLSRDRKVFATDIVEGVAPEALAAGVIFKKSYKGKFPFKGNFFDCLISTDVIEHIADEVGFMNECWRVLKNQGRIIISTPNIFRLSYWAKTLAFRKPNFPNKGNCDPIFGTDQHLRECSKKTIVNLFEVRGWGKIKVFGYGLGVAGKVAFTGKVVPPLDFFANYLVAVTQKRISPLCSK